jgi:hypothetical protein
LRVTLGVEWTMRSCYVAGPRPVIPRCPLYPGNPLGSTGLPMAGNHADRARKAAGFERVIPQTARGGRGDGEGVVVGIDAGGSSTRVRALLSGATIYEGTGGPGNPLMADQETIRASYHAALAGCPDAARIAAARALRSRSLCRRYTSPCRRRRNCRRRSVYRSGHSRLWRPAGR